MRTPLKPRRPTPAEAIEIAAVTAPQQPPAQVASTAADSPATLNLRLRGSTIDSVTRAARDRGLTIKQVVTLALRDAGVPVAAVDLEDGTPRRGSRRR